LRRYALLVTESIGRVANALSTGQYAIRTAEKSLQKNVKNITITLTTDADFSILLKYATIRILCMLQDTRKIIGALTETPEAVQAVDSGTAKRFEGEGPLKFIVNATESLLDLCQQNLEKIQSHIQTVSES